MPDQISVSEFIAETTEDYNSPTTSSFTTRLHNCRNTVTLLEEVSRRRPGSWVGWGPGEPGVWGSHTPLRQCVRPPPRPPAVPVGGPSRGPAGLRARGLK